MNAEIAQGVLLTEHQPTADACADDASGVQFYAGGMAGERAEEWWEVTLEAGRAVLRVGLARVPKCACGF